MSDLTYYQKNRDVILWYDKEKLREQARDKYRNLSEEQKNKKILKNMEKTRCHNIFEDKKQRLKEYQKIYHKGKKS